MSTAGESSLKVYRYRWAILALFALANILIEIHWVAFAPITGEAAAYYRVGALEIGFLSMLFMILYIVMAIPASYVIDTYGIRVGVGFGVALVGIFGLLKGLFPENYRMICVAQTGLAVAQPFILNAYTRLSAQWFPLEERATATGIAALAQYIGIIIAMAVTPLLLKSYGMEGMLMAYGAASAAGAVLFLVMFREAPPTPPCAAGEEARLSFREGMKHIFRQRDMLLLLALFFIGLGIFNAVTTWIEQIVSPRGFDSEQAGILGAVMMGGGIIGATVLPIVSDKMRKRRIILVLCMVMVIPGIVGLAFARDFGLLLGAGFLLGFFIMSAGPIGFQYGAEVSHPAPESTSQGLILLSGQISGILFILGMDHFREAGGSMTPFLVAFVIMLAANAVLCLFLRESKMMR